MLFSHKRRISLSIKSEEDIGKVAESDLKLKKIHRLCTISIRGMGALYFEFYIYLISSMLCNIIWLTQIIRVLIIITLAIILVYIYKELRELYIEGKYLKLGKLGKKTSPLNDWLSLRPKKYIKVKS